MAALTSCFLLPRALPSVVTSPATNNPQRLSRKLRGVHRPPEAPRPHHGSRPPIWRPPDARVLHLLEEGGHQKGRVRHLRLLRVVALPVRGCCNENCPKNAFEDGGGGGGTKRSFVQIFSSCRDLQRVHSSLPCLCQSQSWVETASSIVRMCLAIPTSERCRCIVARLVGTMLCEVGVGLLPPPKIQFQP